MQRQTQKREGLPRDLAAEKRLLAQVCRHLAVALLGALCAGAELLFGVHPFGISLVAAATRYLPSALLGAVGYALLSRDYLSLCGIGILLLLRVLSALLIEGRGERGYPVFYERPLLRVVAAAVAAFAIGLYTVVRGGYVYYDLFGVILAALAAPFAAFLYLGVFEKQDLFFPYSREAGIAALFFTAVFALREQTLAGISPAAVLCAAAAFLLCAHRGALWGALGAGLAGLCFDLRLAPAFALCAICFSLLEKSSRGGGVLAGSAAGAAWGFLLRGITGLAGLLPAFLAAGALFLATDSAGLVEGSPTRRASLEKRRAAAQAAKACELAAGEERLRELSGAFSDLSTTLFELSRKQRRPSQSELRRLCDKAFDEVCPSCRHREICWGSEYNATAEALTALSARLHTGGTVSLRDLPRAMGLRCAQMQELIATVNDGAARLTEEALRGDKTAVVAMDYAALGKMINEMLEKNKEAFFCDGAAGEKITERLCRMGYSLECAAVCGRSHRSVILRGVRLPGQHLKIRELRRVIEQYCRFPTGEPILSSCEGLADIVFYEKAAFESVTVKLSRAKGRSDARYCGDTVAVLSTAEGYDYALLCDGMGSGNMAALTSALSSSFLSRLLQAGCRAETALRMLNGFLAARQRRESESSTTVDLLEIDRVSGEAVLFKCGAAATFLYRRGEVTRFFSHTAPAGILETLDAERIRFHLEEGDVVVQVSDGVTGGEEDCAWLCEMLKTKFDGDLQRLARLVLGRAGQEGDDDLSVLVTEIRAASDGGRATA